MKSLESFEVALYDAIEAKRTGLQSRMFVIDSKPIGKNAAKCAILVMPHAYPHDGGMRLRPGARWIVYVSDKTLWTTEARQLMVAQVANEVAEYVTKGTIHANVTSDLDTHGAASLQRSTDRTVN